MSLMKINDLFHFEKGILQSSKCTEGDFDFITASSEWKTHNAYTHDCEALVFAAAASGSLGRTHYVNGKFISSDLCFIITAKDPKKFPIDLKFYHMIFNEFKNDIVNSTKAGTSKEAIGLKAFGNYKLPYFEIKQQIETKVLFVNTQDSKVKLNVELTHQLDLIKQLRQAFLREAMQGKLLNPVTSSAVEKQATGHELLAKIKAEKAQLIAEKKLKKEKELAPIAPDEIPFEIPEHWAWCRLGDSLELLTDYHANGGYENLKANVELLENENFAIMLRTTNFNPNKYFDYKYITKEAYHFLEKSKVFPGDLIMNKIGDPGVVFFVDERGKPMSLAMNLFLLRFSKNVSNFYMYSYLDMQKNHIKSFAKGSTSMTITKDAVKELLVPIPPLHEQEQIVAKLEELMAFCDGLELSIKESQGYNEMLLQQVLREALQGEKNK